MMNELRNCLQNLLLYYPFKNLTPSSGKYLSAQQGSRLYSSTAQYSDQKNSENNHQVKFNSKRREIFQRLKIDNYQNLAKKVTQINIKAVD